MTLFDLTHETEYSGPYGDVPVIAEQVGPYDSIDDALRAWPGFRVSTDEEVAQYHAYNGSQP